MIDSKRFTRVAAFAVAVLAASAFWLPATPTRAQGAPAADPAIARVKAAMEGFVKGRYKVEDVRKTPLPGIYEVRIGNDLLYVDERGQYLFYEGDLIEMKTQRNLTRERVEELLAIDFNTLPLQLAIKQVSGNGKRVVAVFEDPNCGYCKRLGKELAEMDDLTIYTFLYPILSEDSRTKSDNIWCSKDQGKAWTDWVVGGKTPAAAKCDTASIARNVELGQSLRISGTPTIFLADGTRIGGYVPRAELEKALAAVKP